MSTKPLQIAIKHHQAGELDIAEQLYREMLLENPHQADVLHLLGILLAQQKKFSEALKYIQQAVTLDPQQPTYENSLGNVYKNLNQLPEAITHYQKALTSQPNYAVALNNLGNIYYQQQNYSEAETCYKKALTLKPNYADAYYNLGNIFTQQEKYSEATEYYQKSLAIDNNHVEALRNLATLQLSLNQIDDALKHFLRLSQLQPTAEIYFNIGTIYMNKNRFKDAIEYFTESLKLQPDYVDAHLNLGVIYLKIENYTKATEHYQQALQLKPHDKEISYLLTALQQKPPPEAAPSEYTQHLFDQYAPYFEKHLQYLDYQVPQLLYNALIEEIGPEKVSWQILDLGCGTGLGGEKFRALAKRLIGIDISPKMLAIAEQKHIYDVLKAIDIQQALTDYTNLDLILAADVFTYIGNLKPIFEKSHTALKPQGLFAFTIEKTQKYPYVLQQSARYAHAQRYIEELAQQTGFKIRRFSPVILRKQKHEPVEGYLYILQRSV